jgi:hypothetical protein
MDQAGCIDLVNGFHEVLFGTKTKLDTLPYLVDGFGRAAWSIFFIWIADNQAVIVASILKMEIMVHNMGTGRPMIWVLFMNTTPL